MLFVGEFANENDFDYFVPLYRNGSEIDYDISENMKVGWDVSKDETLSSNERILRMNRNGAVIVNEDNLKVGNNVKINIQLEDVNVVVQCKVIRVENNLAKVRFKDLPNDVANKIAYHYMRLANR